MNLMNHLSNILKPTPADDETTELTADEIAAQEKADRIAFHRTQVRNGPVSWKTQTAGQIRRAKARAQARQVNKNFKREVSDHFLRQRVAATLRPHLQVIGLLPTYSPRPAYTLHEEVTSTAWIVQRYGREIEVDGVKTGHVSFLEEDVLAAIQTAARFYESATGYSIKVPADFAVAISLDVNA